MLEFAKPPTTKVGSGITLQHAIWFLSTTKKQHGRREQAPPALFLWCTVHTLLAALTASLELDTAAPSALRGTKGTHLERAREEPGSSSSLGHAPPAQRDRCAPRAQPPGTWTYRVERSCLVAPFSRSNPHQHPQKAAGDRTWLLSATGGASSPCISSNKTSQSNLCSSANQSLLTLLKSDTSTRVCDAAPGQLPRHLTSQQQFFPKAFSV